MPTIGIDFKIKTIPIMKKTVKMQVWDTAGQERFRNITQTYYKGAAGIVLVYDCTDRKSFSDITSWMKQIEVHAAYGVSKIIVANKIDAKDQEVSSEEGRLLAKEYGCPFFETSAKTGENVNEMFTSLATKLVELSSIKSSASEIDGATHLSRKSTKTGIESRKRKWRFCSWLSS